MSSGRSKAVAVGLGTNTESTENANVIGESEGCPVNLTHETSDLSEVNIIVDLEKGHIGHGPSRWHGRFHPRVVLPKQVVRCPITNLPIEDGIVSPTDGLTYERDSVQRRDCESALDYYPNRALMEYLAPVTDPLKEIQPSSNERGVFLCPITQDLLRDPVIDPEGYTFERNAVEEWIRNHGVSPITRKPLHVDDLYQNTTLLAVLIREVQRQTDMGIIKECDAINEWKKDIKSGSTGPNYQLKRSSSGTCAGRPHRESQDSDIDDPDFLRRAGIWSALVVITVVALMNMQRFNATSVVIVFLVIVLFVLLFYPGLTPSASTTTNHPTTSATSTQT
ncbi:SAM and U-box domain-containing protein 1 [Seminavis robusta]|uniref:SAM and U-box domain-containing protein 1 n=1 Tax=Seminavis robusta TaxID=568900 RepID=A0A9N8HUF9_9STRA|nr:SAM and U-box domain-containing protein 1 [Seminavis robusta]|eukprot:Sro1649_g288610.1 SAM and U-box domain-containing protein 1 (336) ;mRNA; f:17475-18482